MSKYKQIQTEFRNIDSLKAALKKMGAEFQVASDSRKNTLDLYGIGDELRPEKCAIRIPKEWLNNNWSSNVYQGKKQLGLSNDIGFAWNGSAYVAIVSEYDVRQPGVVKALGDMKQLYALAEIRRVASSKGYTLAESKQSDGSVTLTLVHR